MLWDKIKLQSYFAIRQCIDIKCELIHFDRSETGDCIDAQIKYADGDSRIFIDAAIAEIHTTSNESARVINKICKHCLIYGSNNGNRLIDDPMVRWFVQAELP